MKKLWRLRTLLAFLLLIFPSAGQTSTSSSFSHAPIAESLSWIHGAPRSAVEYDYEMTARVRLLFFWAGKDDVGGGYIRRGVAADNPREEMLQVLFGSDPAKAPRSINRWGAGTEAVWHKEPVAGGAGGGSVDRSGGDDVVASTFFGFMKSSVGKSVSEMQDELKKEKSGGAHQFKGIVSQVESGYARSLVVPLASDQDYTLHQYPEAEKVILGKLTTAEKPTRVLEDAGGCASAGGFLEAVAQLADGAVRGGAAGASPKSVCYVYDSQVNTLTLEHVETIEKLDVKLNAAKGGVLAEKSYEHLLQADFVSAHRATGKRVYFTILLGTQGELRGVPVQVRYQPNWWFQVVLNLMGQTRAQS